MECALELQSALELIGVFIKIQIMCPTSKISDLSGLVWGSRIFIFKKFLNNTDPTGPGTTLEELLPRMILIKVIPETTL